MNRSTLGKINTIIVFFIWGHLVVSTLVAVAVMVKFGLELKLELNPLLYFYILISFFILYESLVQQTTNFNLSDSNKM